MNVEKYIKEKITSTQISDGIAKIYISPDIPDKKMNNALKDIAQGEKVEHVLALIDTSLFGNGKSGFVFVGDKLYINNNFIRMTIEFKDIATLKIEQKVVIDNKGRQKTEDKVKLEKKDGSQINLTAAFELVNKAGLVELLNGIVSEAGDSEEEFEKSNQTCPLAMMDKSVKESYLKIVCNYAFSDDGIIDPDEYSAIMSLIAMNDFDKDSRSKIREYITKTEDMIPTEALINFLMMQLDAGSIDKVKLSLMKDILHLMWEKTKESNWRGDSSVLECKKLLSVNDEQVDYIMDSIVANEAIIANRQSDVQIKKTMQGLLSASASVGVPLAAVYLSGSVLGVSAAGMTSGLAALGMGGVLGFSSMFTGIGVTTDPFDDLLTVYDREQIAERIKRDCVEKSACCDKLDYGFAAITGVISALVDIVFVDSPTDNKLLKKVDAKTDSLVQKASTMVWNSDQKKREKIQVQFQNKLISKAERDDQLIKLGIPIDCCLTAGPGSLDKGVQYLEKRFKVVYDSVRKNELRNVAGNHLNDMRPINHHIKSLAHSPDVFGWLFSVIDQFTESATFIDQNRICHFKRKNTSDGRVELHGDTFQEKLFAGTVNWIGHLLSDMSGSTSTKEGNRGMGVCAPFMELFQLCPLSVKNYSAEGDTAIKISELAVKVYEQGYDYRYSNVQMIPVIINECVIRLFWALRQMLQYDKSVNEIIKMMNPLNPAPELQRMLLVGYGALCILDAGGAAIKSVGDPVQMALHMNLMAWLRFAFLSYREINSIYGRKERNLRRMDEDIAAEWGRLCGEGSGF